MAKKPYNFMVIDMRRPLDQRITEQFHIPIKRPQRLLKMVTDNRNGKEVSDASGSGEDSE
jgi:hypothetical protein